VLYESHSHFGIDYKVFLYTYHSCFISMRVEEEYQNFLPEVHILSNIHTYIPITLDPRRDSRGVSDIPPKRPRVPKMT
jgi:hypothetical protein